MHLLTFAIRTLPAEFKNNWQRSVLIILCLAVGIASVSAVKIYTDSAFNYFTDNIKDYFGADLTVVLPQELTPEQELFLDNPELGIVTIVENHNQIAFNPFNRQLNMPVQVTVIDPDLYPLYGSLELYDGSYTKAVLNEQQAAVVSASLFEQLDLKEDGLVIVGNTPYIIRGILESKAMPDGFMGRIYTKTQPALSGGSLTNIQAYVKLNPGIKIAEAKEKLQTIFPDGSVNSYEDVSEHVSRSTKVLGSVALIAALASLLLGGLGVSNAAQVIARQKLKQSAIMKCLGGNTRQIVLLILIQITFIGFVGIFIGFFLGLSLTSIFPAILKDVISIDIPIKPNFSVFTQIATLGLLVTIFFALLPILKFARIRPLAVYRDENPENLLPRTSKVKTGFSVLVLTVLLGLFIGVIIDYPFIGLGFALTTLFFTGLLLFIINLLLKLILKLPIFISTTSKMAKRSLVRQSSRASGAVLALALGISSILLISFVQKDVLDFMGRILDDQNTPNIIALIENKSGPSADTVKDYLIKDDRVNDVSVLKMLQASLETVNDAQLKSEDLSNPRSLMLAKTFIIGAVDQGLMPQELNFLEGEPLKEIDELVIEEHIASILNLKVGDRLGFKFGNELREFTLVGIFSNNQTGIGVNITVSSYAYNASLQGVDSTFSTELLLARTKPGIKGKDVITSLRANVPDLRFAFDMGQIIDLFNTIFSAMTKFMQFLGLFALTAGLIILAGTMILNKWEKRKETALIRCLGGTTKDVLSVQIWENGILGVLSGALGIWLANGLSWILNTNLLKLDFAPRPLTNIFSFLVVLLSVLVVGAISLWDVLTERPLSVLRNE